MDYKIKCAIIADPDKVGNKLNAIAPAAEVLLRVINKHPEIAGIKVSGRENARTLLEFAQNLRDNVDDLVRYMSECQMCGHEKIVEFINQPK